MLNSKGSFQTWAVVTLGQLSPGAVVQPGQLSYLGSCPTWEVVLAGQLSTWAVVAWAVVLAPLYELNKIGRAWKIKFHIWIKWEKEKG